MSSTPIEDTGFRKKGGPGEISEEPAGDDEAPQQLPEIAEEQARLAEQTGVIPVGPHIQIPGMGESGAGCGDIYPHSSCNTCGTTQYRESVCEKRTCPNCWKPSVRDAAIDVTERIQQFRLTQPPDHRRQTLHGMYSPENPPTTKEGLNGMCREAYEVAKEKGVRGGLAVVHCYRLKDPVIDLYNSKDLDVGVWEWVREKLGDDWKQAAEWSPHVHIVGIGSAGMDPGEETDVWRVIRSCDPLDGPAEREASRDLYGLIKYQLSHAAVPTEELDGLRSRRWFGELHGSKFTADEELPDWKLRRLSETVEEVSAGIHSDDEATEYWESVTSTEAGECPCTDCTGQRVKIWRVDEYLEWAEPPPEIAEWLMVCYEYLMGRLKPPPGLANPSGPEECQELLEELVALQ